MNLSIDDQGFMMIDDLLHNPRIFNNQSYQPSVTREEIEEIVETNDKQRFSIKGDLIRATQGHSIKLNNPIMV